MNVSLSTIGNMLVGPAGPATVGPKPDAATKNTQFPPAGDHSQRPADPTQPTTPCRTRAETPVEPGTEERKDFKKVINKQTKPQDATNPGARHAPTQQAAESNAAQQPDAAQAVVAQNPVAIEQAGEGTAPTTESKTPQKPAQLIDGGKTPDTRPAIAGPAKSAQVKLSANATKDQVTTEAVSPEAFKNIPTAAASPKQAENTGETPVSNATAVTAKAAPKASDVPQLTAEASVARDVKIAENGKEQTITEDSATVPPAKTPATNRGGSADQASVVGTPKTTTTGKNTVVAGAVREQNPTKDASSAAQPAQTQPTAPKSDKIIASDDKPANNTQESLPAAETEAGGAAQKTPARPNSANGGKPGHLGNDVRNAASEPAQAQTANGQTETGGSSDSGGGPLPDSAQMLAQTPAQTPVTEQGPIFAVETEPTTSSEQPQTTPGDAPSDVSNQILESVRSSLSQQTGDKEITIQLNPPELGKISVKFQEQGDQITGTLEVSKAQTRAEIEQALPGIIRSLADSGVAIRRIEVVLSQNEQSGNQASKDTLLQDGAFQQRNSANPGQSGNEQQASQTYYGPTGRGRYQHQNAADPYEMLVNNSSINMLA